MQRSLARVRGLQPRRLGAAICLAEGLERIDATVTRASERLTAKKIGGGNS
ncbi:MAG: hypothetical protein MUD03_10865 [Pirellula sp.]|nr:hypothetical protein [Pirellula sp.]